MKSSKIVSINLFVIGTFLIASSLQEQVYDEIAPNQKQRADDEIPTTPVRQNGVAGSAPDETNQSNPSIRRILKSAMSVSVPVFYDMVRNGTSLGINVLSGLVKVERGEEATRNGLQGSRPLSVRVFGVPVFERGQRVSPPRDEGGSSLFSGILNGLGGFGGGGSRGGGPKTSSGEPEVDILDDLPDS